MPENLKQRERNNTFEKVVCDWRCREAPRLLCISNDVITACFFQEEETIFDFHLRENDGGVYSIWHYCVLFLVLLYVEF